MDMNNTETNLCMSPSVESSLSMAFRVSGIVSATPAESLGLGKGTFYVDEMFPKPNRRIPS